LLFSKRYFIGGEVRRLSRCVCEWCTSRAWENLCWLRKGWAAVRKQNVPICVKRLQRSGAALKWVIDWC